MVSTNAIVILVFFSVWTLVEFHNFFQRVQPNSLQIVLELNSIVFFFVAAGIWFFRDRCDGPIDIIESAVLQSILFSPITFVAARFNHTYTGIFGLLFLSVSITKAIWPARQGHCGLPILSVTFASICILLSISTGIVNVGRFSRKSGSNDRLGGSFKIYNPEYNPEYNPKS